MLKLDKYSTLPWRVQGHIYICSGEGETFTLARTTGNGLSGHDAEANAEFIVRAANSHADLLAACKLALDQAEGRFLCRPDEADGDCARRVIRELPAVLRAAIAKAEQ